MEPDAIQFDELVPVEKGKYDYVLAMSRIKKNVMNSVVVPGLQDFIDQSCGSGNGNLGQVIRVVDENESKSGDWINLSQLAEEMPQSGRQTRINIEFSEASLRRALETAAETIRTFARSAGIPQAQPPKKPASNIKIVGEPRKRKITLIQVEG